MNKLIALMNTLHPGYSSCMRCGRNWGWTNYVVHPTSEGAGLFLFCVDCDRVVSIRERWEALGQWKQECIKQLEDNRDLKEVDRIRFIKEINETEFVEFPREVTGGKAKLPGTKDKDNG